MSWALKAEQKLAVARNGIQAKGANKQRQGGVKQNRVSWELFPVLMAGERGSWRQPSGEEFGRNEMNKVGWIQKTPETQRIGTEHVRSHEGPIMWKR